MKLQLIILLLTIHLIGNTLISQTNQASEIPDVTLKMEEVKEN